MLRGSFAGPRNPEGSIGLRALLKCDATASPPLLRDTDAESHSAFATVALRLELLESVRCALVGAAAAGAGDAQRLAGSRLDREADARADRSSGVEPPCMERREESRRDAAAPRGNEGDIFVPERKWLEPRAVCKLGPAPRAVSCLSYMSVI